MGLYSKNRFSKLSAEKIAEVKTMAESAILEAPEITDTPEVSIEEINSTYFDNIDLDSEFKGIIESMLQIHEDRKKILIESVDNDMKEIITETLLLESPNHDKINYYDKIRKHAAKKEYINKCGKKLYTKAESLAKKDADNNKKYIDAILKSGNNNYEGIRYFVFPDRNICKQINSIADAKKLSEYGQKLIREISVDKDLQSINAYKDEALIFVSDLEKEVKNKSKEIFNTKETWKPKGSDIAVLKSYVNNNFVLKDLSNTTANIINDYDKVASAALKAADALMRANKDPLLTAAKLKAIFNCLDIVLMDVLYRYNIYKSLVTKEIGAYRKALFSYGRYCLKGGSSKLNNVIGEAAELYVYETFEK